MTLPLALLFTLAAPALTVDPPGTCPGPGSTGIGAGLLQPIGPARPVRTAPTRDSGPSRSAPSTPAPFHPAHPATPVPSPTIGGVAAETVMSLAATQDPTPWHKWWEVNRERYLALPDALLRLHAETMGADHLARDPLTDRRGGVTFGVVYGEVVPGIVGLLEESRDAFVIESALVALGRIGAPPHVDGAEPAPEAIPALLPLLSARLAEGRQSTVESAILALGLLGTSEACTVLADLAVGSERGAELCDRSSVPLRARAYACYALGLAASASRHDAQRSFAVHHLSAVRRADAERSPDLAAASVIGLGLAFDGVERDAWNEDLGARGGIGARFDELLEALRDADSPRMVRLHAPATLARLADGAPEARRKALVETLIECAAPRTKERTEQRRAALLALGAMGDADDDDLDQRIRATLEDGLSASDNFTRSLAVVALAQVAGQPGGGPGDRFACQADVTSFFLHQLARGKSRLKPWVGMSLGVMGHGLRAAGTRMSREAAGALMLRIQDTSSPADGAAYSIGAGLMGDTRTRSTVEENLGRFREDKFRANVALALGLMGDPGARPALLDAMDAANHNPLLMEEAAVGRAMIADRSLVPELLERVENADCWVSISGATRALGRTGDHRALRPLTRFLAQAGHSNAEKGYVVQALGRIAAADRQDWKARVATGLYYPAAPLTLMDPAGEGLLDR